MATREDILEFWQNMGNAEANVPLGPEGYQFRDPQGYYMENRPALGYDRGTGPIGSTGLNTRYPSVEYQETAFHPETWQARKYSKEKQQEHGWDTQREYDEMLQAALISQNRSNLYGPEQPEQIYVGADEGYPEVYTKRGLYNQRDLTGIKAANVPFQDFSFSEYQGPSQEVEGDFSEEQDPWYSGIVNAIGSPFRFIGDKLKASKYYKGAPDWTPAYNQAGMPRPGYGYTAADLNKMNALGGQYSEPAREHRRAKNRIEKMLERRAQGKKYSAKNLKELSGGQFDFGGGKQRSYQAPTRSAPPGMSAPSSGMHGGQHYATGGLIRSGYSNGGRVGILSVF